MKRLFCIVFSFLLLIAFASCSNGSGSMSETPSADSSAAVSDETESSEAVSEEASQPEIERTWPVLSGDFIQYGMFESYSDARLTQHFDALQEAGMKYIVLYVSALQNLDGTYGKVYFPSETAAANPGTNYDASASGMLERMLKQCQQHGIKAFIPTVYNDEGWGKYGVSDPSWYKKFVQSCVDIAKEIYGLYHEKYGDVMYGWYFNPEFSNYFSFFNDDIYNHASDMLNTHIQGMNEFSPEMKFLMSPYFMESLPCANAEDTAAAWDRIFSGINFRKGDVFAPQDCVGSGLLSAQTYVNYLAAIKTVTDKYENLDFWINVEDFKQSNWSTAPMSRIYYQLESVKDLTDTFISFAYSHYYCPDAKGSDVFHKAYLEYYNTGKVALYDGNAECVSIDVSKSLYGAKLSFKLKNSKYYVSFVDIYRNGEKISTVHTKDTEAALAELTYDYSDKSITEAGTYTYSIIAYDFISKKVCEASAEPIEISGSGSSLSIGKSYKIVDYAGSNAYPDNGIKMTDGVYATVDTYSDPAASGFADASSVTFVIDLGSEQNIGTVVARNLASGSGGASLCGSVTVSVSSDGENYSDGITTECAGAEVTNGWASVEVAVGTSGRYVKVKYNALYMWLFIDEISVYA